MKSPAFDTFQNILSLELRPWMNTNIPEVKYKELQQNLKKEFYAFQPLYEVAFTKPLSARRKYYHALIETEAIQYLNAFNNEMSAALNDQEKNIRYIMPSRMKFIIVLRSRKNTDNKLNDRLRFAGMMPYRCKQVSLNRSSMNNRDIN